MQKQRQQRGPKIRNLTAQRFGRLVILGLMPRHPGERVSWLCKCDCGTVKDVASFVLVQGDTSSCGCLRKERLAAGLNRRHGETRQKVSAEYQAYSDAKTRCNNPNHSSYKNYGGRGIEFRFASFDVFLAELGRRPTIHHSIDRIDNNGHYEVGNVRWATKSEQGYNRRPHNQGGQ